MKDCISMARVMNLYYHHLHNVASGVAFEGDHEMMLEFYEAMDDAYDSLIERHMGLGGSMSKVDFLKIIDNAEEVLEQMPESEDYQAHLAHAQSLESDFRKLLEESKITNLYQAILVFNIDRLTRNWDDVTLIEKHFRENWSKCKLLSVSDSIDLSNASGRAMFRIKMVFNCYMPEDMIKTSANDSA
jgi:DNA-binding ferritin-like protein